MKIPLIKEGIIPLWHNGYYDGPLSGMVEYKGEKHYFDLKKEYSGKNLIRKVFRTFNLYKLTPEQLYEMSYWHNEFCIHVGTHTKYIWSDTKNIYCRKFGAKSGGSNEYVTEMFYERYEKYIVENGNVYTTLDKKQIVGWFTYDVLMGNPHEEWRKIKK